MNRSLYRVELYSELVLIYSGLNSEAVFIQSGLNNEAVFI